MRIQKFLASLGYGSRRHIEQLIRNQHIKINQELATLGRQVSDNDLIEIKGHTINVHTAQLNQAEIIIYNKPEGQICSRNDPQQRPMVFDALPPCNHGRWIGVGRLDYYTQGLLIFTNNGMLAEQLAHPRRQFDREYLVKIYGTVTTRTLNNLRTGIVLPDGLARFNTVASYQVSCKQNWYRVIVTEGRNRIVRKLWASQGCQVQKLIRIRFGPITLPATLKSGTWRKFNKDQVTQLMTICTPQA